MEIIPAIIPKSFEDLREKISSVKGLVPWVQIDITDGVFVPSKSWPFNDVLWESGIRMEVPFCKECNIEFDLMIMNPENSIKEWLDLGAKRIILHAESSDKLERVINDIKDKVSVGLAFNIGTSFDLYENLLDQVDFVQLMGIEKIGFQGEPFSEKVFAKIKELKTRRPDMTITIDGGVNLENATRLKEAGVKRVTSGSVILESDNIKETINKFKNL